MIEPGLHSWAYPSYMVSPYYCWFVLMGYPELDILRYNDGSWAIIQYYRTPVIPSLTPWQVVLGTMNFPPSYGFCEKYVKELDLQKKAFWAREEEKTKQVENEWEATERHAKDLAETAAKSIMKNDDLVNRIAKNGLKEIDLGYLAKRMPKHEVIKQPKRQGETIVYHPSHTTVETVHEGVSRKVHGES